MRRSGSLLLTLLLTAAAPAQTPPAAQAPTPPPAAGQQRWHNLNDTFEVDLPEGWRQIAPNEALRVGELAGAPRDLHRADPRAQYAVGPVDRWLAGDFASPWLYVREIGEEAVFPDDYAERLQTMWREHGAATGVEYTLADVTKEPIGRQGHRAITTVRTSRPKDGPATKSLDALVAAGRQQVTLSFTCLAGDFDRWQPEFRKWLTTATFAREPRPEPKLSDRLWTPLLVGALVGIALVIGYRHTRRSR